MLAARHRLRRSDDFRRAIRQGSRTSAGALTLHRLPGPDSGHLRAGSPPARVGFVVNRAVGDAVVRNRVTRRLRHVVRDHMDALEPGSVLVVRAGPDAAQESSSALAADLDTGLAALRAQAAQPRRRRTSR